jgi:hypothetical protein
MLRSLNDLESYTIGATNGQVGQVTDFYFDDLSWTVRYLIVDTGTWLSSRKVLISPISVREADWANRTLAVSISQEQVKNSPDIDTDQPVSRQHESQYLGYYGYAPYWDGGGLWGAGMYPYAMAPGYMGLEGNHLDELSALEAYPRQSASASARKTRICAAPRLSSATTFTPPTARSGMWPTSWSTTRPGPSATWWSTPATGGSATRCSWRRRGSPACTGLISMSRST